jgi:hypothetical protein
LTGLGVHVSIKPIEHSILHYQHLRQVGHSFTILIVTKEACAWIGYWGSGRGWFGEEWLLP